MTKKIGLAMNEDMPHGFSLRYNAGRSQPFTLWCGDEVIYFGTTALECRVEAVAASKGVR